MRGKKQHPFTKYNKNQGAHKKPFKKGTVNIKRTGLMALGSSDVCSSGAGELRVHEVGASKESGVHSSGTGEIGVHSSGTVESME